MRKLVIKLLAIVMVASCLSLTAFAADTDAYLTDAVIENDVATTYLVIKPQANGLLGIKFSYTLTNATATVSDTGALAALDATMTLDDGADINFTTGGDGILSTSTELQIVKFVVTPVDKTQDSVVTINFEEGYDAEWNELALTTSGLTIDWTPGPAGPTFGAASAGAVATTIEDADGVEYTDVPNFDVTAAITGESSAVKCDLGITYNQGVSTGLTNNKADINIPGTWSTGTITFKVAIVGVPTDVTITGVTATLK